jgi:Mlc titration factor MtfA (ptsG expression regulator)
MPQDSTYHTGDLPDTLKGNDKVPVTSAMHGTIQAVQKNDSGDGIAIGAYLIFILSVIFIPIIIRRARSSIARKKLAKVLESKEVVFDSMLQHYSPYYKSLDAIGRSRFMNRVLEFIEAKEFKYIDIEHEDIMPLLISAAAVQLTFGLKHYKMDYFENIYIVRDIYKYGMYNLPFEGHVSDDGIYLSWNNFMRENNDHADGENLGLHELAHALAYVNFSVNDGKDEWFHDRFAGFSKAARPVFESMQAGRHSFLNDYAATNFNEFWAVSIETFFERPEKFKKELPGIYFAICDLLNQDPLTHQKIISKIEN